jgi:thymidylate synthase
LKNRGIKIWSGNGSKDFLERVGLGHRDEVRSIHTIRIPNATSQGDLGPIYGWQWRHYGARYVDMHTDYTGQGFDQLKNVIDTIKNNPNDRRIILTAWNPSGESNSIL